MDLKIFTNNVEDEVLEQINKLVKQPVFSDCKIRIMPDCHVGKGCVIGFTANLGEKVIPNVIGVDIGCGMYVVELGNVEINFEKLDNIIRKYIPSGKNIHLEIKDKFEYIKNMKCYNYINDLDRIYKSIGTLGGGNHFIEIDVNSDGEKFLVIHSGSRSLGNQVANYYQNLAIDIIKNKIDVNKRRNEIINNYKKVGKDNEIQKVIKDFNEYVRENINLPNELCYLEGKDRENYLYDMKICQEYASLNRKTMANIILDKMGLENKGEFESIHNYLDFKTNIIRKGAISAYKDEKLIIPINMKDGCIIGIGKGNEDWNCSAPHGAGRIMSRSKAKELINLSDFKEVMQGIYTTSINEGTIDEAPMVYKPIDEIVNNIQDSVEILEIVKPIYNFKA